MAYGYDAPSKKTGNRHKMRESTATDYKAYVGPATQFDFMGATQFRLLTTLGLRHHHRLLDIGCGSLRAGRFFLSYLDAGNYYGIEPNQWLIDEAVEKDLGAEFIRLRAPHFSNNTEFDAREFGVKFDFLVAQSIFSHTGPELVQQALRNARHVLKENGLFLATFVHPEKLPHMPQEAPGWSYPECTTFRPERILELIHKEGFFARPLPWYHPRQTWYAIALRKERLPYPSCDMHLSGTVLGDGEFAESLGQASGKQGIIHRIKCKWR